MATPPSITEGARDLTHPRLARSALVLGAEGMWTAQGLVPRLPRSLRGLGELVRDLGERPQVWLHESSFPALGLSGFSPSEHTRELPGLFSDLGSLGPRAWPPREWSAVYWFVKGGAGFDVHVPAWRPDSPFRGPESAEALARAVAAFDGAMGGAPWKGSGAMTSNALLRGRVARSTVPPPLAEGLVRELQLVWHRAPEPDELHYRYCHALDLNGAFLATPGSLELPQGEAQLADFPTFDKRVPGLWHIEPAEWTDDRFPPPWPTDRGESDLWVTTPTMERVEQETGLGAIEAWIWPEHGRHMRGWQKRLRDAREFLIETGGWRGPAGVAVKHVYQHGPGALASRRRPADPPEGDPMYQPYWDLAIIAESRCRLHRRVRALDVRPVAVYKDCLYFLSSRDPRRLALAVGLPLSDRLGHFKIAGTCSGRAARELLADGRGSMANTVDHLRKLCRS